MRMGRKGEEMEYRKGKHDGENERRKRRGERGEVREMRMDGSW